MKLLIQIILTGLLIVPFSCKQEKPAPDDKTEQINQLRKDVDRLSSETQELRKEILDLKEQLAQQQAVQTRSAAASASSEMNIERVKREVAPVLQEVIHKLKKETDTPKQGSQFGMRTEYDTKRAVYGLIRSENPGIPYFARVIVSYQKYLESDRETRAISNGTTRFLFAYRKGRWTFEKIE